MSIFILQGKMKRTLIIIMVSGILCWIWLCLICLRVIPFDMISLYCATILASGITYSSGPIFFEFTVELVYPVPEGVVGGFLTVVYNTTGMIFLFLFYIPALSKYQKNLVYLNRETKEGSKYNLISKHLMKHNKTFDRYIYKDKCQGMASVVTHLIEPLLKS